MALPLLPGNSFNRNVGKEKFHKSQHWGFCNNVGMLVSEDKPGIGGELLLGQKTKPKYSAFPKGMGSDAPSWVAFDKQVLSFDAYLEDEVPDKSQGNYRIRRYKIYFYLEDDTIQVNEPELKNSGMPQGTSIRRQRISLPPPDEDQFYTVHHFNINIDIIFYGRTFKIYDCDTFTKNFLKKIGVKLNPPGQCPEDPYMKIRRETLDCMKPLRPYESFDTLKQFLEYDRKVLRFFCLWDDSATLFGDRRELILHYFLSDDTIEVKEVMPHNSGRDAMSLFLQRRKLPKYGPPGVCQPGQVTDRTVLNIYGGLKENRVDGYLLDKYKLGKLDQEFYKDSDLFIGATINVWGRKVLLCDCDEFTKTYYKTKYGIENFTSIPCKAPPLPKIERKFPPYTGFGSEEDSLRSCIGLVPTPHQRDFKKFMEKDSYGNISNTLRFFAKLITHKCADVDRMFVISYFLSDDTISVFEPIERNSGITGGKFLKRIRVKKPGQEVFKSELSEYIKAEELYIGATVNVNGYLFLLLNADEYTLNYMETNSDMFPMSSIELILQKLKEEESKSREIKQVFTAADCKHTKMVDYNTFRDIIMSLTVGKLIDHELITLARHYRVPKDPCPDMSVLMAQAHEQLKKNTFENFESLISTCVYQDREKKKVLPSKDIRRLCKSFRLPLSDDLLGSILSGFEDSEKQINYESFFCALNWRINPMPELEATLYTKERCEDEWLGMPSPIPVKYINYMRLLKDVFGLEEE
ncbi:EF-hand domain-containing family member C2 isoform X1 [Canis lupus baileyi]|uniref:EF-hand domain-containing family member C2 n=1 Tax=Canis lupus familiaris TaxID=9615 RepID=A0A8C0SLJ9_CANLF|nr:EF-hand domain-containing family member C2 isoform X1 [Canis lupus dingo]XP_038305734.1 EF-hand domain-containing family member C2 isoform X1 [Canis lupus familiaris]XP_038320781.1 EF-hand domain-containing family member C2 isoform X1 [Canis lupus familiaris]XP_038443154.1 EF-hand domain-containing family member C2 isoform X1 [Canis lupus familiaris]